MYPDFLVIGAQKAGTTWLDRNLRVHPQVWLPPEKEIHFFDLPPLMPFNFLRYLPNRSIRNWATNRMVRDWHKVEAGEQSREWFDRYYFAVRSKRWYASLFKPDEGQVTGETTPRYAVLGKRKIRKLHQMMPHCKIIYLLRDPIDRMWSDIAMFHSAKFGHAGLQTLDEGEIRSFLTRPGNLANSRYLENLRRWEAFFPPQQILVGFHDEIRDAPHKLMARIFCFLGVDASLQRLDGVLTRKINAQEYPPMPEAFASLVAHSLADEIKGLHEQFGNAYTASWLQRAEHFWRQS